MGMTASFDVRPGGTYRVEVVPGHTARGEFVAIEPPHRLVHTFGWEPESGSIVGAGSTTVEYELVPDGDGTLLRFTHRGLPNAEAVASHSHGWEHYLERLALVASGGGPGADPWVTEGPS